MHTDAQRRRLYDELGQTFSPETRDVLMELLPPVGWSDLARQSDITALRGEMALLRAEVTTEIGAVNSRIDRFLPRLIAANIASMIGVATLVLAAAQLG